MSLRHSGSLSSFFKCLTLLPTYMAGFRLLLLLFAFDRREGGFEAAPLGVLAPSSSVMSLFLDTEAGVLWRDSVAPSTCCNELRGSTRIGEDGAVGRTESSTIVEPGDWPSMSAMVAKFRCGLFFRSYDGGMIWVSNLFNCHIEWNDGLEIGATTSRITEGARDAKFMPLFWTYSQPLPGIQTLSVIWPTKYSIHKIRTHEQRSYGTSRNNHSSGSDCRGSQCKPKSSPLILSFQTDAYRICDHSKPGCSLRREPEIQVPMGSMAACASRELEIFRDS